MIGMKKLIFLLVLLTAVAAAAYFLRPSDYTASLSSYLVGQGLPKAKADKAASGLFKDDHLLFWIDAKNQTDNSTVATCIFGKWFKRGDLKAAAGEKPMADAK